MYECSRCGVVFGTGSELGDHIRAEHPRVPRMDKILKPFTCADCGDEFELPSYWNPHTPGERRICRGCFDRGLTSL